MIEGTHLIEMAMASGAVIKEVFATPAFMERPEGKKMLSLLDDRYPDIRCVEITDRILSRLAETETPQGVAATVYLKYSRFDDINLSANPLLIVLDGIQDPGNLGTIIRTSDAAGADAVALLPGSCDAFIQKSIRSTSGSIFNIPVIQCGREELLAFLKKSGIRPLVASSESVTSVFEADLKAPLALIFGNEAHGVSRPVRDGADFFIGVPLIGKAESLNVASAAAICIYETLRQRGTGNKKSS